MIDAATIPIRIESPQRYGPKRIYRCPEFDCDEPEGSLSVDASVLVYLDSDGGWSDQGETYYDNSNSAYCSSCETQDELGAYEFEEKDFLLFPRPLTDYDAPKLKE